MLITCPKKLDHIVRTLDTSWWQEWCNNAKVSESQHYVKGHYCWVTCYDSGVQEWWHRYAGNWQRGALMQLYRPDNWPDCVRRQEDYIFSQQALHKHMTWR